MGAPSNAVDPSSTTLSAEDMDSADADADQEPLDLIHLGQTSFDGSFNAVLYSKKDFDVTDADQAAKFLKEVYNYLTYLQNSNVRLDKDRLKTLKKIEKQVDKGSDSRAATQQRSRSKKYPRFESKKRSNKSQKLGGDGVAGGSGSKYKLNDDETLEVMATTTSKLLSEENIGLHDAVEMQTDDSTNAVDSRKTRARDHYETDVPPAKRARNAELPATVGSNALRGELSGIDSCNYETHFRHRIAVVTNGLLTLEQASDRATSTQPQAPTNGFTVGVVTSQTRKSITDDAPEPFEDEVEIEGPSDDKYYDIEEPSEVEYDENEGPSDDERVNDISGDEGHTGAFVSPSIIRVLVKKNLTSVQPQKYVCYLV